MDPSSEQEINFNSVLNFRSVTHFWLCLLELQVGYKGTGTKTF